MSEPHYAPVFEKDGNRLLMLARCFLAESPDDASKVGIGALVECVMFGCKFKGETVDVEGLSAVHATLGVMPIAIISGPLYEEASDAETA